MTDPEHAFLAQLAAGKTVLEVGSWHGGTLAAMAAAAHEVHSIDWHQGMDERKPQPDADTLLHLWAHVRAIPNVVLHVGTTEQVAPCLRSRYFDLVFIDGTHSHEAVIRDVSLLRRTLKHDGRFAFHDYGLGLGVETAILELWGYPDHVVHSVAVCG